MPAVFVVAVVVAACWCFAFVARSAPVSVPSVPKPFACAATTHATDLSAHGFCTWCGEAAPVVVQIGA